MITSQQTTASRRFLTEKQVASLFKKSECKKTYLGSGDTFFGINQIKDFILENQDEINEKKAVKLFKVDDLEATVFNIHFALNKYIAYSADSWEQQLRAPNCAYQQRFSGVDCKTFTVLSSIMLLKCGIKHSLRMIVQPFHRSTEFSHIYVVVPKNQDTGDLKDGYICLDATLHDNKEPMFIKHHDIIMENLEYYGLKGAVNNTSTTTSNSKSIAAYESFINKLTEKGYPLDVIDRVHKTIVVFINNGVSPTVEVGSNYIAVQNVKIPLNYGLNSGSTEGNAEESGDWDWLSEIDFGELFSGVDCWGGSAYSNNVADQDRIIIKKYFEDLILKINLSIEAKDFSALSEAVADFKGLSKVAYLAHNNKIAEGWNSCTTKNLENTRSIVSAINSKGSMALDAYLNTYFNVTPAGTTKYNSYAVDGFWGGYIRPLAYHVQDKSSYTLKNNNTSLPAFEFNEYVSNTPANNFSALDYVTSLTNIIIEATGGIDLNGNNTEGSGNNNSNNNTGGTAADSENKKTSLASFSGIGLALLTAAGVSLAVKEYKKQQQQTEKSKK